MARHPVLWTLLAVAAVVALVVWTPMSLVPAALIALAMLPFVVLAGFGVYHMVRAARRREGPGRPT